MAAVSRGNKALGYVKADVDNLGAAFAFGLRSAGRPASMMDMAALSRMLDLFFTGWVDTLVRRDFPHCYVVFSGGDDLTLIGPWNEVLDAIRRIREDFDRFTGASVDLTLSAGIVFAKPRFPLSQAVAGAAEALEQAKEKPVHGFMRGRNQITLGQYPVRWPDIEGILQTAERVAGWRTERCVSGSMLQNLRNLSEMYRTYLATGDAMQLRFMPLLAYAVGRFPVTDQGPRGSQEARLWVDGLRQQVNGVGELYYLPVILDLADRMVG